jgi:acyl-CoA synthetase (AMP-forming)/AMP-acid ligase II
MRRYRRMVLMDRVIPFLAALVGLIALAGAVVVELNAQQRAAAVSQELARIRLTIDLLSQRAETVAGLADDGTAEGLLALQDRMNALEQEWETRQAAVPSPATPAPAGTAAPASATAAPAQIDPNLPTEDCIPLGTRFMAVTGESYPICQSPAVVRVNGITGDNVVVEGAGVITETGFANLAGTTCTLMVFSADIEGFAEMRVNCT